MIEREVAIPSNDVMLSGTLCLPFEEGIFPTALWIHGSGPLDRDDNMPGQALNNSKYIAHYLADRGVASLRYDKRGIGKSTGDFLEAGHTDLVSDAVECVDYLLLSNFCDPSQVFVIGHSEGSMIAPQVSQTASDIAGIILLCPTIEKTEALLIRQAEELKQMVGKQSWTKRPIAKLFWSIFDPIESQQKSINKIRNTDSKVGRLGLSKQPFLWFREFLQLDMQEIYRNTKCPILAIAGEKDFQCIPSDVYEIARIVGGTCQTHVLADMSHLLRKEAGEANIFNYTTQFSQPIDQQVLDLIGSWIQSICREP